MYAYLKGTVPPEFSPLVFFFKQLLLAPVDKPCTILIFYKYSGRYSTFPVLRQYLVFLLIVPLKALANCQRSYWCINGVNDTGSTYIAGVIDTGKVGDIYCPVSMTPVMHDVHASPVSLTPANACFAGVHDTSE
jgi:hypothetical protein